MTTSTTPNTAANGGQIPPCPFCNGRAVEISYEKNLTRCTECGATAASEAWKSRATLPAALAPTDEQDELPITRSTYGSMEACEAEQARRNAAPTGQAAPNDFLMPEDAWNEYATRSGLLNEHGVAPRPATAQAAYFAYQAAWNCLHKAFSAYIAARQAPTVPKLDYDLLKLTLEQTQERLRQADEAIAKRDATALRVAQCAGEFARDAARQAPTEAPKLDQEVSTDIMGAIARGWCAPINAAKVMDSDLAIAIAREVDAVLAARQAPDSRDAALEEADQACRQVAWIVANEGDTDQEAGANKCRAAVQALKGPAQ